MEDLIVNKSSGNLGEIAIYQPDEVTRLDVKIDGEEYSIVRQSDILAIVE